MGLLELYRYMMINLKQIRLNLLRDFLRDIFDIYLAEVLY